MITPDRARGDTFDRLASELMTAMDAWSVRPASWDEETIDAWARRAFGVQYEGNRPYRRYCEARSIGPGDISGWRDFVPVPTAAFRAIDLIVGSEADAELEFVTSGTTRGSEARGRHLVRSAALYRSSLRAAFRVLAFPSESPCRMVTLPPSFTHEPTSSLGFMLDDLRAVMAPSAATTVASGTGIDWSALDRELESAIEASESLLVLGTTVGFAAWLDRLEDGRARRDSLPPGSMLMDTGGDKGRAGLERSSLVRRLADILGLPLDSIVNEFGMTELLSQRYGRGDPAAPLIGPPWLRSRILHPVTLEEMPEGGIGLLCHFDLANLGSVCAVLTEDRGRTLGEGIEWIGRTEGARPRGCSLATAELLEAQERA